MSTNLSGAGTSIMPSFRYKDAKRAIGWLCEAFGFSEHLVVPGEGDASVAHAQLVLGNAMVMLGSADSHGGNAIDLRVRPATELGGVTNASVYLVVPDADAHHARSVAAGAEIVMEIEDQSYGGRAYSCLDLEGNVWSFGTYDPWSG